MTEESPTTKSNDCAVINPSRFAFAEYRFWPKVAIGADDECWPWTASRRRRGYGKFRADGRILVASRLAWEFTHGTIPDGLWVLHRCDNPPCCNPGHLFLGTVVDNNADMTKKGRRVVLRGVDASATVLTEAQVLEIRRRRANRERSMDLAAEFSVSSPTICRIHKRRGWKHLPPE